MKKALLLLSSIAIFSMAACAKSSGNTDNSVDSSDLYKIRITRSETTDDSYNHYEPYYGNNTNYISGSAAFGRMSSTTYEKREYDSHNSVASETLLRENKIVRDSPEYIPTYYGYDDGVNMHNYINNAYAVPNITRTSYTNKYDKNGNLIYRLGIYQIENGGIKYKNDEYVNYAFSAESGAMYKQYAMIFVEEYKYDNQNRLTNKTYDVIYTSNRYYDTNYYIRALQDESWTFSSFTESYTYQGDSRQYKTYTFNGVAYRSGGIIYRNYKNSYDTIEEYDVTLMNIRQFNDYGDIVSEVETMSASKREVDDPEEYAYYQNGYISYNVGSYAENYTSSTTNTYDKNHCLVESTILKTTNREYLGSDGYVVESYKSETLTEQTMSYYKNNPKKPTSCLSVITEKEWEDDYELNASLWVYTTAYTRSYDELGRLRFESTINKHSPHYRIYRGDIYSGNTRAKVRIETTETISTFIY